MMKDEIKEILDDKKVIIDQHCNYIIIGNESYYDLPKRLLEYITNLQQKFDRALEDSVKETHKLMAIRKYLKDNEREYGSLEDNEKIILGIIEGK